MKILLLNPPGTRRYLRDYYCSHVSKGRYFWQPIDLLYLSGHLVRDHEVLVIDAIARHLSPGEVLRMAARWQPDAVFFLTGSVSWLEDKEFFAELCSRVPARYCALGDLPLFEPALVFSHFPGLEAILFDFVSPAVLAYLDGSGENQGQGYITREMDLTADIVRFPRDRDYSVPVPQHGLFSSELYHLAHLFYHPFVSVLSDFGCPFDCPFCPYERIPFTIRNRDNLFEELHEIRALGTREIWWKDQAFGANRKHTTRILERLIKDRFNFSWSCETRPEFLDPETLSFWKQAGCHTIMIGVETADQDVRQAYKKPIREKQVRRVLDDCRRVGIKSLVHFILGLPGETEESLQRIPSFAVSLDSDFATFNIATPEYGTTMREKALAEGILAGDEINLDSSCSRPIFTPPGLSADVIWRIRQEALKRFYLRPTHIIRHVFFMGTFYQWRNFLREGFSLVRDLLISRSE